MDLRKLKKLIDLVEESGIAELELTEEGETVRISRNFTSGSPAQQHYANYAQPQYAAMPQSQASQVSIAVADTPVVEEGHAVK